MKEFFPFFAHHPDLTYLDSANTTHKPASVLQGISDFYEQKYASVGRGLYDLSDQVEQEYWSAKQKVANYIGAQSKDEIIATYSSTYASNLIAQTLQANTILKAGDRVLISESEHHANIIPWLLLQERLGIQVEYVRVDDDYCIDMEDLRAKMSDQVKVVSLQHMSNVTGAFHRLEHVRSIIGNECIFIVDAAQSIAHHVVDVSQTDCDILFFSGHKMYASMGSAVLYMKKKWCKSLTPPIGGGGAVGSVTKDMFTFGGSMEKWEPGIQNIVGMISIGLAIDFLHEYKDRIAHHQRDMLEYIREQCIYKLKESVSIYHSSSSIVPIFSLYDADHHVNDIADILSAKHICVRSGHHCCEPLHISLGIPGTVRASFGIYNTRADVDTFLYAYSQIH